MPKNSKRGHSGSLNVFTNRKQKLQKIARVQKKSHSAEKKPNKKKNETKKPLVSHLLLEAQKNLWFSARIEPTISCFSES